MIRKLALLIAAAAAVNGCATRMDAANDTRGWFFNNEGEVKLAYGTPQSDDAPLMLYCTPRSGQVTLSQSALRPGDGVTLAAGGQKSTFHGESQPDQLNGGTIVTAQAPVNTPVLNAFRSTGRLAIEERGRATVLTATPAERAQIEQFFASCQA
jgi:hypothetical protein